MQTDVTRTCELLVRRSASSLTLPSLAIGYDRDANDGAPSSEGAVIRRTIR